ncbi:ATP-binding protein [Fibrivirga algicola]|uniref:ATP-binding protein n=1 Tax=Fibrivirga algicola TaxID=2950420 RepID=A0ABX0QJA0_9BACT|nr:ATP-binding protein [Fibrivirga algicola]NID11265.1 ATP-binding protein [Fibrivirga algicola]
MDNSAELKANFAAKMARWMSPVPTETVNSLWADHTPSMPAKQQVSPELIPYQPIIDQIDVQLALSGRVMPDALLPIGLPGIDRQDILNQVVDSCAVESDGTDVRWLMKQTRRLELLGTLIESGTLSTRLSEPLPATDRFGDLLRELLQHGATLPLVNRSHDDRLALMEAMETTKPLDLPQPDWTQVRRQIGLDNFLTDQRALLVNGFVGRKQELGTLQAFLTEEGPPTSLPWRGLVVTGLGGSGKSTLLAKFSEDVVQQKLATLVVFDFDRPGLNPDDRLWLEAEMARQVGYQYPAVNEQLRRERAASRQQKTRFDEGMNKESFESAYQERSMGLLAIIRNALTDEQADTRPLLLVFDTFEEVEQQNLTERLVSWIREVAEQFWNFRLRIIISGRLFDAALQKVLTVTNQQTLDLGELSVSETQTLLKRLSVNDELARRVARSTLIPHRPLELKLLARMLTERADATLNEIEAELRTGGAAARSLFMGLVYRRVLMRIADPTAQKLAYPGLVLRYVTVDLILHVLAPVLKLKLSKSAAQLALDALVTHSWICYRSATGEVWHRKDLRRSMLSAMRAQEPELARKISEAAFTYFSDVDKTKTDLRLQAEQTYHRLLWLQQPDEGAAYELTTLKNAAEMIGADVQDLPKAATVLLQYAQKGRVAAEEVEWLPAEYLQKAYHKTGQRLIDNREFGKALALYERGQQVGRTYQQTGVHWLWELEVLFATAQWQVLTQALLHTRKVNVHSYDDFVVCYIYYHGLISDERQDEINVYNTLRLDSNKPEIGKPYYLKTGSRIRQAIVHIILINNTSYKRSQVQLKMALEITENSKKYSNEFKSTHIQRKLLYIDLIAGQQPLVNLTLAPSLLKIDPIWLSGLVTIPFIAEQKGDPGKALRQLLLDARALLTRRTVRRLLDALDVLYKNRDGWLVQGDVGAYMDQGPMLEKWFRGPDPEFRDPVRFALLNAFRTREGYRQLAGLLSDVLALPFTDLAPDAFAEAMIPDPEHYLEPYIEIVDRNWALGTLLANAVAICPEADSLSRVKAAYDRWDAAVKAAFMMYKPL